MVWLRIVQPKHPTQQHNKSEILLNLIDVRIFFWIYNVTARTDNATYTKKRQQWEKHAEEGKKKVKIEKVYIQM